MSNTVDYQKETKVVNFRLPHPINDKVDRYFNLLGYRTKSALLEAAVREFIQRAELEKADILQVAE